MRLAGIENFLVAALDERAVRFFERHGVPTVFDPSLLDPDSGAGSESVASLHHKSCPDLRHRACDSGRECSAGGRPLHLDSLTTVEWCLGPGGSENL
jgi:hypothetical protein